MSPPHRSRIFPGCHSVQGNGAVRLFNVRKWWIDSVKRSYCGEFKVTTNTRLCSVHFTPDSYNNCHQVTSGYLKSLLTVVRGAEPTLSVPGLHPPVPPTAPTAGATVTTPALYVRHDLYPIVPPTAGATITDPGIMCPPPACILPSRRQRVPPPWPSALCARHWPSPSCWQLVLSSPPPALSARQRV